MLFPPGVTMRFDTAARGAGMEIVASPREKPPASVELEGLATGRQPTGTTRKTEEGPRCH